MSVAPTPGEHLGALGGGGTDVAGDEFVASLELEERRAGVGGLGHGLFVPAPLPSASDQATSMSRKVMPMPLISACPAMQGPRRPVWIRP